MRTICMYAQHPLRYFTIRQIAARILGPEISCRLRGPDAGVAVADFLVMASAAASFERPGMLLKTRHQRIAGVHPYFRERPFLYIAQFVMPPERVGVDVAQIVDIGDIDARGIAAPLFQLGFDVIGLIGKMTRHPV